MSKSEKLTIKQEKRCGHCKEYKSATPEFFYRSNDLRHKDGFARSCKSCRRAYRLAKNVQVERVDVDGRRQCNGCFEMKPVEMFTQGRRTCRPCRNVTKRASYQKHSERTSASTRERYATDVDYKLRTRMRGALNDALKGRGKSERTFAVLGYSVEDLRSHLEKTMRAKWNWDNYGKSWEIDHVLPKCLFDHSDLGQIRQCWALTNLRAYPVSRNRAKAGARYELV